MESEAEGEGEKSGASSKRLRTRTSTKPPAEENMEAKKPRGTKRKPEVNVESLYLQENFKEPVPTGLETIFESPRKPKKRGSGGVKVVERSPEEQGVEVEVESVNIMGIRKVKRLVSFNSHYFPPKLKMKQRKDRARRLKQLTGVRVPRGSGVSEDQVWAALACLSENDDLQIENNQNINNQSFSGSSSSEFYCGNILRPDTSNEIVDYVTNTMSELSMNLQENKGEMLPPILEGFLPFDDEPSDKNIDSREKRRKRRSGRVVSKADLPPPLCEEPLPVTENSMNNLDVVEKLSESNVTVRNNKPNQCRVLSTPFIPLSEDIPPLTDNIPEDKREDLCTNPPLFPVTESLLDSIQDEPVPQISQPYIYSSNTSNITAEARIGTLTSSTTTPEAVAKPVEKRTRVKNPKVNSIDPSAQDLPRKQAKERTRQRKTTQDISNIKEKVPRLDMGQKREDNSQVDNVTSKKKKSLLTRQPVITIPEGDDSVVAASSAIVEQQELLDNCVTTHILNCSISGEDSGYSLADKSDGRKKGKGGVRKNVKKVKCEIDNDITDKQREDSETNSKSTDKSVTKSSNERKSIRTVMVGNRRTPRTKRRVSGVSRALYRKSVTEEEIVQSSPEILGEKMESSSSSVDSSLVISTYPESSNGSSLPSKMDYVTSPKSLSTPQTGSTAETSSPIYNVVETLEFSPENYTGIASPIQNSKESYGTPVRLQLEEKDNFEGFQTKEMCSDTSHSAQEIRTANCKDKPIHDGQVKSNFVFASPDIPLFLSINSTCRSSTTVPTSVCTALTPSLSSCLHTETSTPNLSPVYSTEKSTPISSSANSLKELTPKLPVHNVGISPPPTFSLVTVAQVSSLQNEGESTVIRSPTSPSEKLAALSLHSDQLPSPITMFEEPLPSVSRTEGAKKKSRRQSARLSYDRLKVDTDKQNESKFGSLWADGSPFKLQQNVLKLNTSNYGEESRVGTSGNSNDRQSSVEDSESLVKENQSAMQTTKVENKSTNKSRSKASKVKRVRGGKRKTKAVPKEKCITTDESEEPKNTTRDHSVLGTGAATAEVALDVNERESKLQLLSEQSAFVSPNEETLKFGEDYNAKDELQHANCSNTRLNTKPELKTPANIFKDCGNITSRRKFMAILDLSPDIIINIPGYKP